MLAVLGAWHYLIYFYFFFSAWQDGAGYFILNVVITVIFLHFSEWNCPPPDLLEIFLEFIDNALSGKVWFLYRSKGV